VNALQITSLTVERGGRAVVKDLTIEIPAGQVTALLGPNGTGKSTLVLAVGGVLKPKSGEVLLEGADITGRRPERIRQAGLAIVPEGRRLLPDLTVEDNLRVASYALTREGAQAGRAKVLELFPQLEQRLSALARTLSGGEQQMVAIGQALMAEPKVLMLDEPTSGLAPIVIRTIYDAVGRLRDDGMAVLIVEQSVPRALANSSRCYVMERGRIVISGESPVLAQDDHVSAIVRGTEEVPSPAKTT